MNHTELHAALVAACDPIVKHYRNDLLVHDLDNIQRWSPDVPFLHFSRQTGTYMVHLIAADQYPARGQYVPFLFGHAEREHLLDSAVGLAEHCAKDTQHICHYWDGRKLRQVTTAQALTIATEYSNTIRNQWRTGVGPAKPVVSYLALGM